MNDLKQKKSRNKVSGFFLALLFSVIATVIVFIAFNLK